MTGRALRVSVSVTGVPHFRRLVDFATEVDAHAQATGDEELQALVRGLREDLAALEP